MARTKANVKRLSKSLSFLSVIEAEVNQWLTENPEHISPMKFEIGSRITMLRKALADIRDCANIDAGAKENEVNPYDGETYND